MFKFTRTNYCHTAPSLGGGCGIEIVTCFSRSPKLATSLRGVVIRDERGDIECPQLTSERLERDGVVIFDRWVD